MGHIGVKGLKRAVEGIDFDDTSHSSCVVCAQANIRRVPFPQRTQHQATKLLHRIHCDICGPLPHCYGNFSYFILFIDCYSRYISLFLLKQRDDALDCFIEYRTAVQNYTGETLSILRVDNAPELVRGKMESYCRAQGVTYEKTIPDSPSQNGVAERTNLTIGSMARAMLIDADLKDYFWPFATQAAVHIKNRVPHSSLPPDKTPFELWHRYKPNLSHLCLFGVTCTSRVLSNNLTKFTPRGETGRFLGYAKDAKGYLVWIPGPRNRGGTVKARRDVVFHDYPVLSKDTPPTDAESNMWDDVTYSDQLVNSYVHIVPPTSF
jgi:hypothetical protein